MGLGRDVKRAAPEIYVGCLSEGSRSIREWVETNFHGSKTTNSEQWVEVWDRAAQVDFLAAKFHTDEELLNCYGELDDAKFLTRFGFVPGKANGEYIASLQKGKLPFGFKLY